MRARERLLVGFEHWGYDTRRWALSTRRNNAYRVRKADRWLTEQGRDIFSAKTPDIQAFLVAQNLKSDSVNNYRVALIGFYSYLQDIGLRQDNPAKDIPRLPRKRSVPKALGRDVIQRIIRVAEALGTMDECLVKTFAYSGMRLEEVRTLQWPQVEEEPGWVRFIAKGSKERVLPLHRELQDVLKRWRVKCRSQVWVFPSPYVRRNTAMSTATIYEHLRDIGRMAGVPNLHPHLFRHSFATEMLEVGVDLVTVQEALGHENIATTSLYLRVRPGKVKDAVQQVFPSFRADEDDLPIAK